jgi:hemolysin D
MFKEKFLRLFDFIITVWKNRAEMNDHKIPDDLKCFLAPALEIMETPPHPAPRMLLKIFLLLFLVTVFWSILGKMDIITTTEGKIIPSGKIKEIRSFDREVVDKILVTEDQLVKSGDILIEMDKTQNRADLSRLSAEKEFVKNRNIRLEILVQYLDFFIEDKIIRNDISIHASLKGDLKTGKDLEKEYLSIINQWQVIESQLKEKKSELAAKKEEINRLTISLPLKEEQLVVYQSLFDKKMLGLNEYNSAREQRDAVFYGLKSERENWQRIDNGVKTIEMQLKTQIFQDKHEIMTEIRDLDRQNEAIEQEVVKVQDLISKQTIYAPVAGTVKGLLTNTQGGVVEPAQLLMELVPRGEILEVEAFVANKDIGYIHEDQKVEIKVQTFPFTKYGTVDGEVINVAEDATIDEKLGLIYRIRIKMGKNSMMVDGVEQLLIPGMGVTAEINTGQRRIIEYFLAPLLRMKDESLRER